METLKLRPYQEEDVQFLQNLDCAGCFNEQRTGKTPTALMTVKAKNLENEKILIITTSSGLYQWADEYRDWLHKPVSIVEGTPTAKKKIISEWTHGLIISLGTFKETKNSSGYLDLIIKQKPKMVILDEAHHIRNFKTKAAASVYKLCTKVPIRLALTGTPAYGKPQDIYSILHFLYPKTYTSPYKFQEEYLKKETIQVYDKRYHVLREISNYTTFLPGKERMLQKQLATFCTQRKRKEVMQWLPEKDKQLINLPLTKEQTKYLSELQRVYQTEDLIVKGVLDRLVRYRQICIDPMLLDLKSKSPKTEWILNFIEENPDTPLIIFSNFTQYLLKLFDILEQHKVKEAMIIGDVPAAKRRKFQNDFQSGKFNVFLINTASGKEALTLDRAEAIIFADLYPPIGSIEQAEDRFVSTSEDKADKPHTIYYLMMQNSFEENIWKLLQERKSETEVINCFRQQLAERSKE